MADLGKLLARHRRVLARRVPAVPGPAADQAERRDRGPDNGVAPTEEMHERGDERRRDRRPELQPHGLKSDDRRPVVRRKPALEDAGGDGKGGGLGDTQEKLQAEQHRK